MAAASKKKMTLKEVKAPDEFLTSMGRVIEFLQLYGGWIAAGTALVVVAIVAGILLSRRHDAALVEESLRFYGALAPVVAADVNAKGDDEKGTTEVRAKLEKAAGDIERFVSEHEGSPLVGVAWAVRGAALWLAGQPGEALSAFEKSLQKGGDSTWKPILLEAAGAAAEAAGRLEDAGRYYAEMTKTGSRLFRAVGYLHLGDLAHPLAEGGGDAARAREAYQKGIGEIPGDDALLIPAERLLRRLIEQRIASVP